MKSTREAGSVLSEEREEERVVQEKLISGKSITMYLAYIWTSAFHTEIVIGTKAFWQEIDLESIVELASLYLSEQK